MLTCNVQAYSYFAERAEQFPNVSFSLMPLEKMHWKQAAALFATTDIVVFPHGAQTSSALFMPMRSEAVHISASLTHTIANRAVINVRQALAYAISAFLVS